LQTGVPPFRAFEVAVVGLVLAVALAKGISALLECSFTWCPDTPVHYQLLYRPS
jgi:hypothetical protein